VEIHIDGIPVRVPAGVSVAVALMDRGVNSFRTSVVGEPRAPLCGMGICYECRVSIDGVAHRRACMVLVEHGMRIETESPA
jgi:sarcosine oxidase subunit alpha